MTIYVLIPVFNRLFHTEHVIHELRRQTLVDQLCIVVINDGSTDGTSGWLQAQSDIVTLSGDGDLWWGGSINRGLQYVASHSQNGDYVLFLNNDTRFKPDYIETLVRKSREHNNAAVGSVIHETEQDPPLVSVGPRVNLNRLAVWDMLAELQPDEIRNPKPIYHVDALSGRGTLYPVELFERYGGMRPKLLPHYLADYEIAMRFARNGIPLIVSSEAIIFSPPIYGNDNSRMGWWDRHFSLRSSSNIIHRLAFYMMVGSPLQRISAPLRMIFFSTFYMIEQWKLTIKKVLRYESC
jgi:GT2 family glycosyltransferase